MRAFRYIDDALMPCADVGATMRLATPRPPLDIFDLSAPLTRTERRRWARRGHRGRRGAVRVAPPRPLAPWAPAPSYERLDAQVFRHTAFGDVLLYCAPTARDFGALERMLADLLRRGAAERRLADPGDA